MHDIEINHHWPLDDNDWPLLRSPNYSGVLHVSNTPYNWEIGLDAIAFKPSEIKVSVRPHEHGHELLVEGSHEQRDDEHGSIAREIRRICHIPDDVDTNTIVANLFPNGLLSIKADKKVII
uniref:SHSP domain-containing protein n=1 Tax=Acrobeloides nanus TaxID=290746 RepID=A0A914EF67_9BILA